MLLVFKYLTMIPPVSIIVPIYNVEKFIERCARSLFEQSLVSVEYIFVNDCTPDRSMEILQQIIEEYQSKNLLIKVVSHEENKGLPSARNSGLKVATGEYIFHCDSDDWLEPDAMEKLYRAAKHRYADIVWCDWFLSFKKNERRMPQKGAETPIDCMKAMLSGKMKFNVWNKLVRRSLYTDHDIRFPDGYGMGEDMTMMKLFAFAQKVCYLPLALYHYLQLNTAAFTKSTSGKHLQQVKHNADDLIRFIRQQYGELLDEDLQFFKLNIKLPFLITDDENSFRRWLDWYPEANDYIRRNKLFSRRAVFLQQAALKQRFWLVKLYYRFVIKVIYGVLYR
jgi:glycosyltransferase involved in cell wall biosynthesis